MIDQDKIITAALMARGLNGRLGLPLILWGPPGIGKTAAVKRISRSLGFHFRDTSMPVTDPVDLAGFHVPDIEGQVVRNLPATWVEEVNQHKHGAVQLFDEMTSCEEDGHAAMMRIVLEGKAGDVQVAPTVRFMFCANPIDCATNATPLPPPMANRLCHLDFQAPDFTEWVKWLQDGRYLEAQSKSPTVEEIVAREAKVADMWPGAMAQAEAMISAFIMARPTLFNPGVPEGPERHRAHPSPRSWELAVSALASSIVHDLNSAERYTFIRACVGSAATKELQQFLREVDLPAPDKLLDGEVELKLNKRADRTMAILSSCQAFLASTHPIDADDAEMDAWKTRVDAFWGVCRQVIDAGSAELVKPSAEAMVKRNWDMRLFPGTQTNVFVVMQRIGSLVRKVTNNRI